MPAETASLLRAIEDEMVAVEELAETPEGQGCSKGTEPRGTEILEKGVLASRGTDFRVSEQALSLFFYFYLFSFAVASPLCCTHLYHGHYIFVRVALYSNQQ